MSRPLTDTARHLWHRLPFTPEPDHGGPLPYVARRPSVKPILPVSDMQVALVFYRSLGFEVSAYDDGYAWVKHCSWEFLHLRRVDAMGRSHASAYIHVGDVVAWRDAMSATAGDAVDLSPVVDQPWGMREFEFADPDGNLIRIGQNL